MFVAVRINVAELGVPRVDPIINIRYPAARGDLEELALVAMTPNLNGQPANMVVWTLDTNRHRMAFRTSPLNFDDVSFVNAMETNYLTSLDTQVGVHQTQMAVLEHAEPIYGARADSRGRNRKQWLLLPDPNTHPDLSRRHSSQPFFRRHPNRHEGDQNRRQDIQGFGCGGEEMMPDSGIEEMPADGGMADAMAMESDAGPSLGRDESDATAETTSGGGGGGGCQVDPGSDVPALPFLALLLAITPLIVRRTRR